MYKKEKKTGSLPIMWQRHAKRTIGWLCPSSSRCKEVRGQPQRDRGTTSSTMCTHDEIERGTHAHRASKLGPVERLRNKMLNPKPNRKSLSKRKRGELYCTPWYMWVESEAGGWLVVNDDYPRGARGGVEHCLCPSMTSVQINGRRTHVVWKQIICQGVHISGRQTNVV